MNDKEYLLRITLILDNLIQCFSECKDVEDLNQVIKQIDILSTSIKLSMDEDDISIH